MPGGGLDPVIKSDMDGANSVPLRIDNETPHFGRLSATRRAGRTVYMGSAPRPDAKRGVDPKSVVLGCVQPGEPPGQFADALKRVPGAATHLYVDGTSIRTRCSPVSPEWPPIGPPPTTATATPTTR